MLIVVTQRPNYVFPSTAFLIQIQLGLIKDCIVFVLLIAQVALEHTADHGYIGQVVIVIAIIVIYRKYVGAILGQLLQKVKAKMSRG